MHVAAANGHIDIIKMLVDAEASISAKNYLKRTPLHLAARYGRVEAVKYLMQVTVEQAQKSKSEKKINGESDEAVNEDNEAVDEHEDWETETYLDEAILNGQRYVSGCTNH